MEEESERADVSEVIEARGHPGRKSHESRASGREQCRAALLVHLLLPSSPPFSSVLLLPSSPVVFFFLPRGLLFSSTIRSPTFASYVLRFVRVRPVPPSQSPSALLRVASVLIRFDPSRRLTLKQTLFMTRGITAKQAPV